MEEFYPFDKPELASLPSGYQPGEVEVGDMGAYLPHSCDEWVIGGADNVRAMIADLTAVLLELDK